MIAGSHRKAVTVETSRTRIFQALTLLAIVAVAATAVAGYRQIDSLQIELLTLADQNDELNEELQTLRAQLAEADEETDRVVTEVVEAVGTAVQEIRGDVTGLETVTDDLSWRVDDVEFLVSEMLEDLGRCLYFEAIQARYTYWYEEGFSGRYVTSCS